MNKIVKFDTPEMGMIEKSKAEQIKATFEPMAEMLLEFESAFTAVITEAAQGITKEVAAKAKSLRLAVAKIRIKTEEVRKEQKYVYRG